MDEFRQIFQFLPPSVIAACAVIGIKIMKAIKEEFSAMKDGITQLNTKIAVIVERVDSHEKRITRIEDGSHK